MIKEFQNVTPAFDKILAVIAGAAAFSVAHLNTIVGLVVGLLTVALLIPRIIIAWRQLYKHDGETKPDDD